MQGSEPEVGRSALRREDPDLLTGSSRFVDDLALPGMVHARFVRSPLAHAAIRGVDAAAARATGGVVAVLDGQEIDVGPLIPPLETQGALPLPQDVLARTVARFAGEPLAVVVAESPYIAEDAVDLVSVDLEPLPVVADPEAAVLPGSPAVHEGLPNVTFEREFAAGDVEDAFARAVVTFERRLRSRRSAAVPLEPRGLVVAPEGDGICVWASTQTPYMLRDVLAEMLGLAPELVRVMGVSVGGGFGQKAHVYVEDVVVAWLALRLQRPVKWIEDRSENLLASGHARDQTIHVRAAADASGRLLAVDVDLLVDVGAYGPYAHGHIIEAAGTPGMIPGPYRLGAYRYRTRAVCTNKVPLGGYRGVGMPLATFVHERVMDILARELGLDAVEVRRRNLLTRQELPYTSLGGHRYDSGDYPRALAAAAERIGAAGFADERRQARAAGRLLGLGFASYTEFTAPNAAVFRARGMVAVRGDDAAHVALHADGRARVWTTLPPIGQGSLTTFAQIAADALGLPFEAVSVEHGDTRVGGLNGTGTAMSRSAISGGGAILAASAVIMERLREDAADELEVDPEDMIVAGGRVQVRGAPARGVPVGTLVARAKPDRYRVSSSFDPDAVCYAYATHACVVEIDPDTARVTIRRYVVAEDCGRVINPAIVKGQVVGGVAQGIGGALYELHHYDEDGQLQTASFMDYLLPSAREIPALEIEHLGSPADTPTGARGAGEGGAIGPPAAIANAVGNALGVECNELPITPEWVWQALR